MSSWVFTDISTHPDELVFEPPTKKILDPPMLLLQAWHIAWPKYFSESIALKSKLEFCHTVQSPRRAFGGLSPSATKLQSPLPNWNMKHYKTVMFVQISECQAPLHNFTVKFPCRRLSGDGSAATPSFSLAIFWKQWLDFNTIHEFTFKFYLLTLPIAAL